MTNEQLAILLLQLRNSIEKAKKEIISDLGDNFKEEYTPPIYFSKDPPKEVYYPILSPIDDVLDGLNESIIDLTRNKND